MARFDPSSASNWSTSVKVITKSDSVLEGFEYLSAILVVPHEVRNVVNGSFSTARITITDNTSKSLLLVLSYVQ